LLIRCDVGRLLTIDDLPDDVLLDIFDFHVATYQDLDFIEVLFHGLDTKKKIQWWKSLVQVCRRWRDLVLGSPRRLNLQICCTPSRSAGKSVDVWPTLPLLIDGRVTESSVDNVIAELKHSDRIRQIGLTCHTTSKIEKIWTAMQVPFPELAGLWLSFEDPSYVPVVPDSFLDGPTPRLRFLALLAVPFPGLPKLLLSATHLVHLWLANVPHSGYISPEAMATCLSMLTSLESLQLEFESPQSCPDWENRPSPPPTRSTLPALTVFSFKGVNEYSEVLVSRIDAPRLYRLFATFFNDIDFDTPELNQFISRTPIFGAYNEAHLIFLSHEALVSFEFRPEQSQNSKAIVEVKTLCNVSDWQLSFLRQICTMSLCLLLTTEKLYIKEDEYSPPNWKDDIENTEWLDLLLPFTAVKNLYLSTQVLQRIAPALQDVTGGRTAEVLPALEKVFLEGFHSLKRVPEGIGKFISARQLTTRPVTTSIWKRSDYRFSGAEVRGGRLSQCFYRQNSL
jgi:hypothetical protein